MTKYDASAWYTDTFLKNWPKAAGTKPTADNFELAHKFGKPGKQTFALAMSFRADGVTAPEIIAVLETPQNNKRNGLVEAKLFKRVPHSQRDGHDVYKLELTATGTAFVERRTKQADAKADKAEAKVNKVKAEPVKVVAAAKPKAKAKPKAVKAVPVQVPVIDPLHHSGLG
jgi:hypothetical protein